MAPSRDPHQPKSGSIKDLQKKTRPPLSVRRTPTGQIIMTMQLNHKASASASASTSASASSKVNKFQAHAQDILIRKRRHLARTLPPSHPLHQRTAPRGNLLRHAFANFKAAPTPRKWRIPSREEVSRAKRRKRKHDDRESARFVIACTRLRHMWERTDLTRAQEHERHTVRSKMQAQSRRLKIDHFLAPIDPWLVSTPDFAKLPEDIDDVPDLPELPELNVETPTDPGEQARRRTLDLFSDEFGPKKAGYGVAQDEETQPLLQGMRGEGGDSCERLIAPDRREAKQSYGPLYWY